MKRGDITSVLKGRSEFVIPALCAASAFFLRYHFLTTYSYPLMLHEQDAIGYFDVARKLLSFDLSGACGSVFPPLYPTLIALFSFLPVDFEFAARLASISMDALVTVPLYYLARLFLDVYGAAAASVLWAVFGFSLYFTPSPLSQSTYLCFLLFGIILLQRGLEGGKGHLWVFCGGVCLAFAYLTRPEGIVGFGLGIILYVSALLCKKGRNRRVLKSFCAFSCGFVVFAVPYWIMLHNRFGHWTFTAKTAAVVEGAEGPLKLNKMGDLIQSSHHGISLWLEAYGGFMGVARLISHNFMAYFRVFLSIFPWWMHALAVLGFCCLLFGKGRRNKLYLLIPLAVTVPVYIANIPKTPSYIYPVFPVYFIAFTMGAIAVCAGAKMLAQQCGTGPSPGAARLIVAVPLFLLVSYFAYISFLLADGTFRSPGLRFHAMKTEMLFKESSECMKSLSAPNDIVMSRWGLISYFAGRPQLLLPKGDIQAVVTYGRKNHVKLMLIDTESVYSRRQELTELLDPLYGRSVNRAYGLEPVCVRAHGEVGGYVVYRFL